MEKTQGEELSNASLIERINDLQKKLDSLGVVSTSKEPKGSIIYERYKGPLTARYWMWGGVPVVKITSTKKDPTQDYLFKSPQGVRVDNHYLNVELANGKVDKMVSLLGFNMGKTLSEDLEFNVITKDGSVIKRPTHEQLRGHDIEKYVFDVGGQEIEVFYPCIN